MSGGEIACKFIRSGHVTTYMTCHDMTPPSPSPRRGVVPALAPRTRRSPFPVSEAPPVGVPVSLPLAIPPRCVFMARGPGAQWWSILFQLLLALPVTMPPLVIRTATTILLPLVSTLSPTEGSSFPLTILLGTLAALVKYILDAAQILPADLAGAGIVVGRQPLAIFPSQEERRRQLPAEVDRDGIAPPFGLLFPLSLFATKRSRGGRNRHRR
jgi:hypothetical protein